MKKDIGTRRRRWIVMLTVLSLTVLWSFGGFSVARADNPNAICILQIASAQAGGKIFSVLTNQPQNFNVAITLPLSKIVNVPLPCDGVATLALGMANQTNNSVNVAIQLFTTDGVSFCSKGPFTVPAHGAYGTIFSDCQ
jgi:hypothetical protein